MKQHSTIQGIPNMCAQFCNIHKVYEITTQVVNIIQGM